MSEEQIEAVKKIPYHKRYMNHDGHRWLMIGEAKRELKILRDKLSEANARADEAKRELDHYESMEHPDSVWDRLTAELESTKAELRNMTRYKDQIDTERKQLFEANTKKIAELNAANEKLRPRTWPEEKPEPWQSVIFNNGVYDYDTSCVDPCWQCRITSDPFECKDGDEWLPIPTPSEVSEQSNDPVVTKGK